MGSDNLHHKKRKGRVERCSSKFREYRNSILIICEGEKTEKLYFKSFPVTGVQVKTIGTGRNTESLVDEAVKIWKEFAEMDELYEKLWCVFDRDSFSQKAYNNTFNKIVKQERTINRKYKGRRGDRKIKISIAYSNQDFELWYLLHFDYFDQALHRDMYHGLLTKRMKKKYQKNDSGMYIFFEKLCHETQGAKGQAFALKNAEKLRKSIPDGTLPHNHNPSTSVDLLVAELNKYLKR